MPQFARLLIFPTASCWDRLNALGSQGEPRTLANGTLIPRETSLRECKPLSDMVLVVWGEPANLG